MLKTILAISGKPGLYKLISQAKNMLIVENIADKKRMPVYASDKVISLGDIAMYTDAEEVPLATVLESVKKKENGAEVQFNYKKASSDELHGFMAAVLPNYDRDVFSDQIVSRIVRMVCQQESSAAACGVSHPLSGLFFTYRAHDHEFTDM